MFLVDLRLDVDGSAEIRPVRIEDIDSRYVDGLNDPEVHRFLVGPRNQRQTLETVRAYVSQNISAKDSILLGMFIDEQLRGTSRLHEINEEKATAYIGIALFDRAVWGRGWGTKFITSVVDIARDQFGIRTLYAGICIGNIPSIKAFRKAGFISDDATATTKDPMRTTHWMASLGKP